MWRAHASPKAFRISETLKHWLHKFTTFNSILRHWNHSNTYHTKCTKYRLTQAGRIWILFTRFNYTTQTEIKKNTRYGHKSSHKRHNESIKLFVTAVIDDWEEASYDIKKKPLICSQFTDSDIRFEGPCFRSSGYFLWTVFWFVNNNLF